MIFYPIHFKGLNLWRKEEVPLGLLGWHGIVPCKTRAMSETMVGMVKSELLEIEGIFKRLDSFTVADVSLLLVIIFSNSPLFCLRVANRMSLFSLGVEFRNSTAVQKCDAGIFVAAMGWSSNKLLVLFSAWENNDLDIRRNS